ncbi:hypothetical protein SAMN02745887_03739 [Chitinimonas taiwanensis DSM 18899]|uniref:Uncharacterized protein n=1 Tax=Chitinimonas taiwanensis DSM 18899 TaxID=1121279 RepID=A0A1K2HS26_9NEIS|nr:hypothetical protein SAMN02745887_03739 [Chitinimonas taiwanensis DSM 18899]
MSHETTASYLTLGPLLRDPCPGSATYGADKSSAEVDADADELTEAQLENLFLHIRHGLPNGIVFADWLQPGTLDRDSACYLACGLHPVFWAHGGGLPAYAQPSLLLAQADLLRHRAQQAGREVDTPQGWLHWFQQLAPLLGAHFKLNRLFVDAVAQLSTGLDVSGLHGAVPAPTAATATAQTLEKRVGRPPLTPQKCGTGGRPDGRAEGRGSAVLEHGLHARLQAGSDWPPDPYRSLLHRLSSAICRPGRP